MKTIRAIILISIFLVMGIYLLLNDGVPKVRGYGSGSTFPTSTDNLSNNDLSDADHINNIQDWLGVRNSTDTDSITYRLTSANQTNPGHKHTTSTITGTWTSSSISGLTIGTNVQAWDALLDAIAALTTANNELMYFSGANTVATTSLSAVSRSLFGLTSSSSWRTQLDVQPLDTILTNLSSLVTASDELPYFTGADTWATTTLTSQSRSLLSKNSSSSWLTQLGFGSVWPSIIALNSSSSILGQIGFGSVWPSIVALNTSSSILGQLGIGSVWPSLFTQNTSSSILGQFGFGSVWPSIISQNTSSSIKTQLGFGSAANQPITDFVASSTQFVLGATFDNGGSVIDADASTSPMRVSSAGTIKSWFVITDLSCTIKFDVWKTANSVPTNANRIAGTDLPTVSSSQYTSSSALTGWTTTFAAGDLFTIVATGTPSGCTRANVGINYTRP